MQQAELDRFKTWLAKHGAEIVPPKANEVIRFRNGRHKGVVQRTKKGELVLSPVAGAYFEAFTDKRPMPAKPVRQNIKTPSIIENLLARDGTNCFYCHEPLGEDLTREHLFSQAHGGPAHIANLALAHKRCNADARDLPVVEKIKRRDNLRHKVCTSPVNVYDDA